MECLRLFRLALLFTLPQLILLGTVASDPMKRLRDFENSSDAPQWRAQNDGVMGGVSTGGAEVTNGLLTFTGVLSLENNGGFAQIYSPTELVDFSEFSAVNLRIKGDGRTYQFRIETSARYRNSRIAYRAEFKTEADTWIEVSIPFSQFVPSFRGRTLSGPPLDLTDVQQVAFLLGDGKPGAFALKVDWIGLE